jgi:hypothetical protein
MFRHFASDRLAWTLALGTALVSAASAIALPTGRRPHLSGSVLDRCRGGNQGNGITQSSCDTLQGNYLCEQLGADCTTCAGATVNTVTGAGNSYATGGQNSACGQNLSGTCEPSGEFLLCNTDGGNPVGSCPTPPQIMSQAH